MNTGAMQMCVSKYIRSGKKKSPWKIIVSRSSVPRRRSSFETMRIRPKCFRRNKCVHISLTGRGNTTRGSGQQEPFGFTNSDSDSSVKKTSKSREEVTRGPSCVRIVLKAQRSIQRSGGRSFRKLTPRPDWSEWPHPVSWGGGRGQHHSLPCHCEAQVWFA